MIRYFPLPSDHISSLVPPPSPASSTSVSSTFSTAQLAPPAPASLPSSTDATPPHVPLTPLTGNTEATDYASHAIPPKLLSRVLDIVDSKLSELETLLSTLEMRFVGASVLVVYEGDPDRLAAALERYDSKPPKFASDMKEDDDSEDGMDLSDEESDSEEDEGSDDLDGPKAEEREKRRCPPVVLKMIDFAHTWLADGEGPDQGVLLGIKTLRGLLAGRKADIVEALKAA
jgi:1D-myo-inositol-tetrakisphosphate 5-kinase/inositol-polyphosphate multikinase